ncbi:MAG: class I SAM-dependent methyltransferase [Acidobacteria bacterium]|nr:class I SAM-dependent methyltransferase [Acidobacteriota bacterium]
MFENFPKKRPPLPAEYQEIYDAHYKENREGGSNAAGLAQKLERWMHRCVAADTKAEHVPATLEVGGGTLNHLEHEPNTSVYDVVEPFRYLYESSPLRSRVRKFYDDIREIPAETKYGRIVSIATFEHIEDLPSVVARCGLLIEAGGSLRVAIPSEGTILWKLGYTLTTGAEFKKRYGLDYEVLMKHEHVNTAREIEEVLRYFFSDVKRKVFGVAAGLSIYQYFECRDPDLVRCRDHKN